MALGAAPQRGQLGLGGDQPRRAPRARRGSRCRRPRRPAARPAATGQPVDDRARAGPAPSVPPGRVLDLGGRHVAREVLAQQRRRRGARRRTASSAPALGHAVDGRAARRWPTPGAAARGPQTRATGHGRALHRRPERVERRRRRRPSERGRPARSPPAAARRPRPRGVTATTRPTSAARVAAGTARDADRLREAEPPLPGAQTLTRYTGQLCERASRSASARPCPPRAMGRLSPIDAAAQACPPCHAIPKSEDGRGRAGETAYREIGHGADRGGDGGDRWRARAAAPLAGARGTTLRATSSWRRCCRWRAAWRAATPTRASRSTTSSRSPASG